MGLVSGNAGLFQEQFLRGGGPPSNPRALACLVSRESELALRSLIQRSLPPPPRAGDAFRRPHLCLPPLPFCAAFTRPAESWGPLHPAQGLTSEWYQFTIPQSNPATGATRQGVHCTSCLHVLSINLVLLVASSSPHPSSPYQPEATVNTVPREKVPLAHSGLVLLVLLIRHGLKYCTRGAQSQKRDTTETRALSALPAYLVLASHFIRKNQSLAQEPLTRYH